MRRRAALFRQGVVARRQGQRADLRAEREAALALVAPHGGGDFDERFAKGFGIRVLEARVRLRPLRHMNRDCALAFREKRLVNGLHHVRQEWRKQLERRQQDVGNGERCPRVLTGCVPVVKTQLRHFEVIIRQIPPEESLDFAFGGGVIVPVEQIGDAADQALGAGENPAVGGG